MFNFLKGNKQMATATKIEASDIIKVDAEVLIERMVAISPNIVGKLPDRRMQNIVRTAMRALAEEVNAHDAGGMQVAGLGRINIRQVETENNGTPSTVKRIVLKPAKPKV
ncbi:hypothetical protein [Vreelandella glaciei]|uniref:hypothetical protein n=1 Tax=Vreelandella glaciei TaxID=186761 RepID=UPI0030EDAD8B|tara:strand:+ start:8635 stop:8964 length:330 start_codon:yes stop_codon:yes gene_type:complete